MWRNGSHVLLILLFALLSGYSPVDGVSRVKRVCLVSVSPSLYIAYAVMLCHYARIRVHLCNKYQ